MKINNLERGEGRDGFGHDTYLRVGVSNQPHSLRNLNRLRRPLHGFTLVELLVVIFIMAVLIALLLPALAAARQEALSVDCLANLRSQGQMLFEYADAYGGAIPYGWDMGGTDDQSGPTGANDYDLLLFSFNQGVSTTAIAEAYSGEPGPLAPTQYAVLVRRLAATFVCPASLLPMDMRVLPPQYITTYASNPNFFYGLLPPGCPASSTVQKNTFRLSAVVDASQKVAIGDVNQGNSAGNPGLPIFDWEQNWGWYTGYPNDYPVPAQGWSSGTGFNSDYPNDPWGDGLRYRHGQTSPNSGWANALFFDGHAQSIPINDNTPGAPPTAASAQGNHGLRVLNVSNPALPASILQITG